MDYRDEYELEINLKDLFFYILYQWRITLLTAVLVCALAAGYAVVHNAKNNQNALLNTEEQQQDGGLEEAIPAETEPAEEIRKLSPVKYAVLGFAAGIFCAAFFYAMSYILSDRIRGDRELRERYSYYLLGTVPKLQKKRKLSGIDSFIQRLEETAERIPEEEAYRIISANIMNLAKENSMILVTGTVDTGKLQKLVEEVTSRVKGVTLVGSADMNTTASTLERLASCDAVILVEERNKSLRTRIHREKESISALEKPVVGYVML